jgi:hypothetical protein
VASLLVTSSMPWRRKRFETPILEGREPWAAERQLQAASAASQELSRIVRGCA